MKIRTVVILLLLVTVVAAGLHYIRGSLSKSAAPPAPSRSPSLADAPVRLYGLVEPRGREVFVGPTQARRVVEVCVQEGQSVTAGQTLCVLDADLERHALAIAESRLEEAVRRLALTVDERERKRPLADEAAVSKLELRRLELQIQLEEQQIATARAEIELRRTEQEKLTLRAPLAGVVYKLDVRAGEQLTPQDYARIVVGHAEQQVRLFVETFWLGRVAVGTRFRVREAETLHEVGTGTIESVAPYVGARDFRTEDRLERLDVKYGQAILRLDAPAASPIGMQVICERIAR
ncbi:MAG: biotin/lipoyl-binding protein [Candidatus Anammoximicrobium sp.]|nr:biotin/lipoyl-binding protein [Candidatus Anammoximicrobium sp.]